MLQQAVKPEAVATGMQRCSSQQSRPAGSPRTPQSHQLQPAAGPPASQRPPPQGDVGFGMLPPPQPPRQARARLWLLRQGQTKAEVSLATGWDESFQRPPPPHPAVPRSHGPGTARRAGPSPAAARLQPGASDAAHPLLLAGPRAAALGMRNYLFRRTVSSADLPNGQPRTADLLTYVSPHCFVTSEKTCLATKAIMLLTTGIRPNSLLQI